MTSQSASRRLLSRLHRDLQELQDHRYPGVTVFTDDANLREFCLVLIPPCGPFKDIALHFEVVLPDNWPTSPPNVKSSISGIDHPNLFGNYICCDLLKHWAVRGTGNYSGGYSPALTLQGLFLQFLTFFSSTKVEQEEGGFIDIGDYLITTYMREAEFASRIFPHTDRRSVELDDSQQELARLWLASPSEEVIVAQYAQTETTEVTHTLKYILDHTSPLHKFEKVNPRWERTLEAARTWKCWKCPYGSTALPHLRPASNGVLTPPITESLGNHLPDRLGELSDDLLEEVASWLAAEDVVAFGIAYPRFKKVADSFHILLKQELSCFFLRTPLRDSILGIGLDFTDKYRSLVSDFDWLSLEAFKTFGVNKSVLKRPFSFFLPLAFNSEHFQRAETEILKRLCILDNASRNPQEGREARPAGSSRWDNHVRFPRPPSLSPDPTTVVRPLYKMMNNIVVSLMKSCDDNFNDPTAQTASVLHQVSEKAITSYCQLFHLLLCLCRSHPSILQDAKERVLHFSRNPNARLKSQTPDLGEFIVLITLVAVAPEPDVINTTSEAPPTWSTISSVFIEEAFVRNVRWILRDSPNLEVMESGVSECRLKQTFANSKTSLRLMMFQVTFLDLFIEEYGSNCGVAKLNDNYGFPNPALPERMVREIKAIYEVNGWIDFFERVRYEEGLNCSKEEFCEVLRKAVGQSGAWGYHIPSRRSKGSTRGRSTAAQYWV